MATKEKQKIKGFMGFYKFSISKSKPKPADQSTLGPPKPEKNVPPDTLLLKKMEPIPNNLLLKQLENFQDIVPDHGDRRKIERGGGRGGAGGGFVEARRSVSHVETNLSSVASFLQIKVLVSDMPGFMQTHAFRCARTTYDSQEKFSSRHMAYNMKKDFDKVYGPAWHCIVGSNFGSFVTHSTGCFLYFQMEKLYILIFKTKVRKNPKNLELRAKGKEEPIA